MTRYKLKPKVPAFQVTAEGTFAYHTFKHGEVYEKIPPEQEHKFNSLGGTAPTRPPKDSKEVAGGKK